MRKIDWPLVWIITGFVILSLIFFFKPGGEAAFTTINNMVTVLLPAIGVLVGAFLIKSLGIRNLQGKAVLFLTFGFFSWGLADAIWTFITPETVSVADIFYFLGYFFLMIGIFYGLKLSNPDMFKNFRKTSFLTGIIVVLMLAYFFFYPFSWDPGVSFLENLTTAGYLIADLLLAIPLVFLVYSLLSGALSLAWIFIGLGVVSTLIADLWYAKNYDVYYLGHPIELLWSLGYFLFIYAFVHFKRANDKFRESLPKKKPG